MSSSPSPTPPHSSAPPPPRSRLLFFLTLLAFLFFLVSLSQVLSAPPHPPRPAATPLAAVPALLPSGQSVGPLYLLASPSSSCTASVLHSSTRSLVLTAAHCVSGDPTAFAFAPGASKGSTPHGVWHVTAAWADPAWLSSTDPDHDYAILSVAPHGTQHLEDVVPGNLIDPVLTPGSISVTGYPSGENPLPVTCTTSIRLHVAPHFDCDGFPEGTSGSPWLRPSPSGPPVVVGLIAGLDQGGCDPSTSFSPPLTNLPALLTRAESSPPSDSLPLSPSSC